MGKQNNIAMAITMQNAQVINSLNAINNKFDDVQNSIESINKVGFNKLKADVVYYNNALQLTTTALKNVAAVMGKVVDLSKQAGALQKKLSFDMLGTGAIVDISTAERDINNISKQIREFSVRTKINMGDTADVVNKFLSNGFSQDLALELIPDMNRFKGVFQTNLSEMSDLYKNLGVMGIDLTDQTAVSNSLNSIYAATSNANVSFEDYNKMLKNSAPVFNKFGMGIDQISAKMMFLSEEGYSGDNITKTIEAITMQLVKAEKTGKSLETHGIEEIFSGEALIAMQKYNANFENSIGAIAEKIEKVKAENHIEFFAKLREKSLDEALNRVNNIASIMKDIFLISIMPALAYILGFVENIYDFVLNLITPFSFVFDFVAQHFEVMKFVIAGVGIALSAAFAPAVLAVGAIIGGFMIINAAVERFNEIMEEGGVLADFLKNTIAFTAGLFAAILGYKTAIVIKEKISSGLEALRSKHQVATNALLAKELVIKGLLLAKQVAITALKNPLLLAAGVAAAAGGIVAMNNMVGKKGDETASAFESPIDKADKAVESGTDLSRFTMPQIQTIDPTARNAERGESGGRSGGGSNERIIRHEVRLFLERGVSAVSSTGDRSNNGVLVLSLRD